MKQRLAGGAVPEKREQIWITDTMGAFAPYIFSRREAEENMEEILQNIRQGVNVRENLTAVRKLWKEPKEREEIRKRFVGERKLLASLLTHEDPKVRKNAALLIGELGLQELFDDLFQAYEREETLFARADYLRAMEHLDISGAVGKLKERLADLAAREVTEENRKHYREELSRLQKLVLRETPGENHGFTGFKERYDVLLTTNRNYREITARQVKDAKVSLVPLGVRVRNAELSHLLFIPTFRELLFWLDVTTVEPEPEKAAAALAGSNLLELLERGHGAFSDFRFRITVSGKMPLNKRGDFIKKCAFELERFTERRLINSADRYEAELKLAERKDGTFLPLLKLYTLKDTRFSYRKETIAASIHPADAALIAALTASYFGDRSQVLDPFCGVGTMLIERDRVRAAGLMYGIDIFGEAIAKARINTARTGKEIFYINRDFFDFTHEYLFDEIFTNMPLRGRKTREEQDLFYRRFFDKAGEVLKRGGVMILYSDEKGLIKKQLRLREEWRLLNEFCLNEKEDLCVFVIGLRK